MAKEASQFLHEAENALNPETQFYAILNTFKSGKFDPIKLRGIINEFIIKGKRELANSALETYRKSWMRPKDSIKRTFL